MSSPRRSMALSLLPLLVGATSLLSACRKPDLCVGGLVTADGACVAKCDPTKCLPGNTCVGNACVLTCTSHLQCTHGTQACLPANEDFTDAGIFTCQEQSNQGIGDPCLTPADCGDAGLRCLSSGPGDATAYCSGDCLSDSDCPGGFECGWQVTSRQVCGVDSGVPPRCGATTEPCLDPAVLGASGSVWSQGNYCVERRTCYQRRTCSACTSNVDCSITGKVCAPLEVDGGAVCAATCAVDTDCGADRHCVSGACLPRFPNDGGPQACLGSRFCEPCRFTHDCAPGFGCARLKGEERSCIDLDFTITCTRDADCPVAPSGLRGHCLDARSNVGPTDELYHHCYAPYVQATNVFSCYRQPPVP